MANLSVGELDRRIQVFRATEGRDNAGDPVMTWDPPAEKFDRWAKKSARTGGESTAGQQVVREADTVWTLRWDSQSRAIAPENWRIMHQGTVYEIVSIAESRGGRMDALEIVTSSRPDLRGDRGRNLASGQP